MKMTYTSEQFDYKKKYKGQWGVTRMAQMADWAIERSVYNRHMLLDVVVDARLEIAVHCLYCDQWGSIIGHADDFGINGPVIYEKCKGEIMENVKGFWNYCPYGGKKHGIMELTKNEYGGLLLHCPRCYKPRKKRGAR